MNASPPPSPVRVSPRLRFSAGAQVVSLLFLATILDYVSGPAVSASAFYIFPVGLAGWRFGRKNAALTAVAAAVLNALTIWLAINWHGFTPNLSAHQELIASQSLHAVIYGAVALLAADLRHRQQLLEAETKRVEELRSQMETEMHTARKLQELLFKPPPHHPAVEIGTFLATARILGGDALDVSLSGNRLAVLVADVSGKGSSAALATAVLLGVLENCPTRFESPAQTLTFLNERLMHCLPDSMFITALCLLLDTETGVLTWSSGGHEVPLLFRSSSGANHPAEELTGENGAGNLPLAVFDEAGYEDRRVQLAPGDVLFCYTDGLTDLRLPSGERLGMDRLRGLFERSASLPCVDLIPAMLKEATGQTQGGLSYGILEDDLTMVALRRTETGSVQGIDGAGGEKDDDRQRNS